jgi:TetR/AcrR family transcriptional repressor of nem operon
MKCEHDTKLRLLDTAIELIWENGYGAMSVDEICKKAEVCKGSFYHFFPSKSDLAVAALDHHWEEKRPNLDCAFSPSRPPLERLTLCAQRILEIQASKKEEYGKVCGCSYAGIGSEQSTLDEKIRAKVVEITARYQKYFETAIRDALSEGLIADCDPRKKAEELFAYASGLLLQAKLRNSTEPLENMATGFLQLAGVRHEAPALV